MKTIKTRFTRKLHFAFAAVLLITVALAWYFYDSARWFALDAQRIAEESRDLEAYQRIASLTYAQLHAMADAVAAGDRAPVSQPPEQDGLRNTIAGLRQSLEEDRAGLGRGTVDRQLELLAEIETVVAEILAGSERIFSALEQGRRDLADEVLGRLRADGAESRFSVLIDRAILEQRAAARKVSEQAISVADYVTRLLPLVMTVLIALTVLVVIRFSRSLKNSIGTLHQAVSEYSRGNLKHRIPDISEREFQELGSAFNAMADQLAEHRTSLRESNIRLEATVDERTRALKESNEKLARVDETRRRLLADISHEFRTPLTVIKGESEIALRGKDRSPEEYRESLRRIVETADFATGLVEDLLFIVRADAGEPRLEVRTVEITELLRGVCEDFAAKASARDLEIRHEPAPGRSTLSGDPRRLRQVFGILLDNALRYSKEGGEIEVDLRTTPKEVVISVRDQGIGLSEEEARQAFQRFYRGRQAIEHAEQGTGLGLPVAKAIVEAHQGSITLTGEPGKGAVATVTLPIKSSLRAVA